MSIWRFRARLRFQLLLCRLGYHSLNDWWNVRGGLTELYEDFGRTSVECLCGKKWGWRYFTRTDCTKAVAVT